MRYLFSCAHYQDTEFELYELQDGEVRAVRYRGAWVLVDNGYLNWAVTIPPLKNPVRTFCHKFKRNLFSQ